MAHRVAIIQGDGIGPEVVTAALKVLEATGVAFEWDYVLAGEKAFEKMGDAVPDETIKKIKENGIALKAPLTNFVAKGYPGPNRALRRKLGLYAAVKWAKSYDGVQTLYPGVDIVVIRETKEGGYAGAEQQVGPDAAVGLNFVTRRNVHEVTRFAMEFARRMGRKKITITHKANALKLTDGLFLLSAQEIAEEYPDIECDNMMVDHMAYQLVKDPLKLDMVLAPNVYGDIFADLVAGLAGSLGIGYGGNFGPDVAVFEAVHGTAPKYAGTGIANPMGMMFSGAMLLNYIGESEAGEAVKNAVAAVIRKGETVTKDLGGKANIAQVTDAVIWELQN